MYGVLGGSWVVISAAMSPLIWFKLYLYYLSYLYPHL